ncbi:hypothetical protein ACOMHN_058025 [Nucella lapillus]
MVCDVTCDPAPKPYRCVNVFYVIHSLFYVIHSLFYVIHSLFYVIHSLFYVLHSLFYVIHSLFYVIHSLFPVYAKTAGTVTAGCTPPAVWPSQDPPLFYPGFWAPFSRDRRHH